MPQAHSRLDESDDEVRPPPAGPNPDFPAGHGSTNFNGSGGVASNVGTVRRPSLQEQKAAKRRQYLNTLFWVILALLVWMIIFDTDKLHPTFDEEVDNWEDVCTKGR